MDISEDIGAKAISRMKELLKHLDEIKKWRAEYLTNFPQFPRIFGEKRNYQLHLVLEKSLFERLKKEAMIKGIILSDYCRGRLRGFC